jgi:transporter family protein
MNLGGQASWQVWAVMSALFAALTAIFAKIGVENVNSDLATLIRTLVVVCVLGMIVYATGQFQDPAKISGRTYLFLLLSGSAPARRGSATFAHSSLATQRKWRPSTS